MKKISEFQNPKDLAKMFNFPIFDYEGYKRRGEWLDDLSKEDMWALLRYLHVSEYPDYYMIEMGELWEDKAPDLQSKFVPMKEILERYNKDGKS